MLKILLTFLILLDLTVFALLIFGVIASIKAGGGSVLLPSLGMVVSLPLVLAVIFVIELGLVAMTIILYRYIKDGSGKLA